MDDETFDRIARRIEPLTSRRAALGGLAGVGLLSALGGSPLETVDKRKKKRKKKRKLCTAQSCPACQRCNSAKGCEPDPDQLGVDCGNGNVCFASGACLACGASNAPCCPPTNTCDLGTVCLGGECEPCGFVGAPCCSTGSCAPFIGSGCFSGTCELCGAAGEQCCPGGICNGVNLFCNGATCQS